jgi:uncharacterized protein (TIGR02001 family)
MIRFFAAAALAAAPAAAGAQELSGQVDLVSQYVFRGIAQSDGEPTLQAGAGLDLGRFNVSVWGSGVDFTDGTDAEIDYALGWSAPAGPVELSAGAIHYSYVGGPAGQDFTEVYAGLGRGLGGWAVSAAAHYSPEFYLETGEAVYLLLGAERPLGEHAVLGLTAGGTRYLEDAFSSGDYEDVGVSLSRAFGRFAVTGAVTRTFGLDEDETEAVLSLGVALP